MGIYSSAKRQQNSGSKDEHALSLAEWSPVNDPAHAHTVSAPAPAAGASVTLPRHACIHACILPPVMPSAVATNVQGPPGPRMHTPGEDGLGVGTG